MLFHLALANRLSSSRVAAAAAAAVASFIMRGGARGCRSGIFDKFYTLLFSICSALPYLGGKYIG
jgi:hypothetical protein